MERKTKHRLLGILVIISLAIISFSFFQNKSNSAPKLATVQAAPPFPDQPIQVEATNADSPTVTPEDAANLPRLPSPTGREVNVDDANKTLENPDPEATIKMNRPSIVDAGGNKDKINSDKTLPISESVAAKDSTNEPKNNLFGDNEERVNLFTADKNIKSDTNKTFAENKNKHIKVKSKIASNSMIAKNKNSKEDFFEFEKAVWVIQMGSFKNKENALRLLNQLRTNGYHAFIRKHETAFGERTKVFVGPESKKALAYNKLNRLKTETNIQGILLNFKPFEL